MSRKKTKWVKCAFSEESLIPKRMKRSGEGLRSMSENDSIDLTLEPDDDVDTHIKNDVKVCNSQSIEINFKSSNWVDNFAPHTREELSIHPKKIAELDTWFESSEANKNKCRGPILLITGPSGCGKTTTLKLIAKEMGYSISEWTSPVDAEFNNKHQYDGGWSENQNTRFISFLFQSSRYGGVLNGGSTKRLVLVKDLPNVFIRDTDKFNEVLVRYNTYGRSPLVFIVTDTKSKALDIAYSLFPDAVLQQFAITKISFNAVADTLLKRGLNRICNLIMAPGFAKYYTEPNKETVDTIVLSSQGDIRSAVINLHFSSQKNACPLASLPHQLTSNGKEKRKTRNTKKKLKSIGCDESVNIMHALGRVFNPKYEAKENSSGFRSFIRSPDDIANVFATQPSNMLTLMHTNYLCHFNSIENALSAADDFTCADTFLNEWREDLCAEIAINVAVRGLMVHNEKPVSGFLPIKSSKIYKHNSYEPEKELKLYKLSQRTSVSTLATDYRHYAKLIKAGQNKT